jgi:cytochrome c oxidase assembly factor CtaG
MISAWNWSLWPSTVAVALLAVYAIVARLRFRPRSILYFLGILVVLIALASPLHILADQYLFTARELQALLLFLVAPALLVLGLPASPSLTSGKTPVNLALAAWTAGMFTLALWQIPRLFDASLQNQSLRILEQASLLVTGAIFWWPVLGPRKSQRLPPVPWASVYLFAACVVCSLIGLLLTYTPAGAHRAYLNPSDTLGILPLIRDRWHFSPETDQETGGLLIWAGGCMVCAVCVMGLFLVWYNSPEVRNEFSSKTTSRDPG